MSDFLSPKSKWISGFFGLVFSILGLSQLQPMETSVSVLLPHHSSDTIATSLPYNQNYVGSAEITIKWELPFFVGSTIRLVPDEHLESLVINGEPIDIQKLEQKGSYDWPNAPIINVQDRLHYGTNVLKLIVSNASGSGGVDVSYLPIGWKCFVPYLLMLIGGMYIFNVIAQVFEVKKSLYWAAVAGVAMVLLYWFQTPFSVRQFDVFEGGGHLDYIRYLWTNHALPPPDSGWEYHQPPLYYLLATFFYALGDYFYWLGIDNSLRWLSFMLWLIFLAASMSILQRFFRPNSWSLHVATFAFCCWPSGLIHAVRVGNDLAFYACYGVGLWAACRWWRSQKTTWYIIAAIGSLLAVMCKANGLALSLTLLLLLFFRFISIRGKLNLLKMKRFRDCAFWLCLTQLFGFSASFYVKFTDYISGRSSDWLLGNVSRSINSGLAVSNDWKHMLWFDWAAFIGHPWLSAWEDASGRQFFWNYLLRSAISSEFRFNDSLNSVFIIAGILLVSLFCIFIFSLVVEVVQFSCLGSRVMMHRHYKEVPLFTSGFCLVLFLMAYRYKVPFGCNGDFRYIYPALISLIALACGQGWSVTYLRTISTVVVGLLGICGLMLVFLM